MGMPEDKWVAVLMGLRVPGIPPQNYRSFLIFSSSDHYDELCSEEKRSGKTIQEQQDDRCLKTGKNP
jgi:hypothetical protein